MQHVVTRFNSTVTNSDILLEMDNIRNKLSVQRKLIDEDLLQTKNDIDTFLQKTSDHLTKLSCLLQII